MATSFFSLLLLGVSGWLIDSHRRDWNKFCSAVTAKENWGFARKRYLRRMTATSAIALVGISIAFWPLVPQEPRWVLPYTGVLSLLAVMILTLGLYDAIASRTHLTEQIREENRRHRNELIAMINSESEKHCPGNSSENSSS